MDAFTQATVPAAAFPVGAGTFEAYARARTPYLLRVAYLLTGTQHDAEDLVQSALERVALAWPRLRRKDGADAYVRRTMYRLRADRWRRGRAGAELPVFPPPDDAVRDAATDIDVRLAVRRALAELTPRQRAVLVLRFFEDLSTAETATVLGCSVGTVKSQTHLALRRLRAAAPDLEDLR